VAAHIVSSEAFINYGCLPSEVLAVPEIGNSAVKAAAQADFVILSMYRKVDRKMARVNHR
jgi:hypothetical protein